RIAARDLESGKRGKDEGGRDRADKAGMVTPAERRDEDRQRRETEQEDGEQGAGGERGRQGRRCGAACKSDKESFCVHLSSCPARGAVRGGSFCPPQPCCVYLIASSRIAL